jgi:hypothetical protein
MALIDDLKQYMTPEAFTKFQSDTAVSTRVVKGDELYGYYVGDEPPVNATGAGAGAGASNPGGMFDLSAFERVLDARLGKIDERIDTKLTEFTTNKVPEFVNNTVKIAVQRADELNRIYLRHHELTGKPFDSADFNAFLDKPENKTRFRTLNDAYDAYAAPTIQEKTIATEVDRRVKASSGTAGVPGTTPVPATNSNIRFFQNRGRATDGAGQTAAQRAAAALDARAAARQQAAS